MLAIMNVGKYVISSVVPSGENIFRVLNDSALSSNVRFFASNGSRIVGIVTNGCVYSNDEGMSWSNYHLNYQLAHIAYLNNTFYAVEESGNPLHYGISSDGISWTWHTISDVPASAVNAYGISVVEEVGNVKINYGIETVTGSDHYLTAYQYDLTTSTSSVIGESAKFDNASHVDINKRLSRSIGNGYAYSSSQFYVTVCGDFGATSYNGNSTSNARYYKDGNSICDRIIYGTISQRGSGKWARELYYTSDGVNWQAIISDVKFTTTTFLPYGFFKVGNTFYLAFTKGNDDAYWVKAGSLLGALNMPDDEIEKVSDVDLPVSFYAITNKKIVLATTTSHIYTCEIG